jgi:hypothetical protein
VGKGISFDAKSGVISLSREVSKILAGQDCKIVTSEMLGKAEIPDLPYEDVDGKPLRIDTDYFGKSRNEDNPMPGPFELPAGQRQLKVWPIKGKQK